MNVKSSISEVVELWNLDQNYFQSIYSLFNSKLNGQKLEFNSPLNKANEV